MQPISVSPSNGFRRKRTTPLGTAEAAKANFYRAEGHLARWQRETLLDPVSLRRYCDDLHRIWGEDFERGKADCKGNLIKTGQRILVR
jgi:hypothetical protein